jgi:hypothetical protein
MILAHFKNSCTYLLEVKKQENQFSTDARKIVIPKVGYAAISMLFCTIVFMETFCRNELFKLVEFVKTLKKFLCYSGEGVFNI